MKFAFQYIHQLLPPRFHLFCISGRVLFLDWGIFQRNSAWWNWIIFIDKIGCQSEVNEVFSCRFVRVVWVWLAVGVSIRQNGTNRWTTKWIDSITLVLYQRISNIFNCPNAVYINVTYVINGYKENAIFNHSCFSPIHAVSFRSAGSLTQAFC